MREKDRARSLGPRLEEAVDLGAHVARARPLADVRPGEVARAVLEVRREHLVARLQLERPGRDVHPGGRVRHEL